MPIVGAVVLLIQFCFAYQVLRTGRPYWWMFIIMAFPVMGCVIYYFKLRPLEARIHEGRGEYDAALAVYREILPAFVGLEARSASPRRSRRRSNGRRRRARRSCPSERELRRRLHLPLRSLPPEGAADVRALLPLPLVSKQPWVVLPPDMPAVPEFYKPADTWPAETFARWKALRRN